ncbi:MAG: carbohydrate kinase [Prevotella sp.]|nr:carbohydrate kinase [Prevotella sp.]
MRKVIGIGETVFDIIFKEDNPVAAVPGGSTFNAIISLGRAGINTTFISETGDDRIGRRIIEFLKENGVNADSVSVYQGTKSPLSLAFLNERNDAEYIFYKDHPNDRLDFIHPAIERDDIVLMGSYYAINPVIRQQVAAFLDYAKEQGAIIYYDVNYRASHKHEIMRLTPNIIENLEYADIVRGSSEDFEIMYKKKDADSVYKSEISFYTKKFIYTQGSEPVELRADGGLSKQYTIEKTDTVSTIGAGDNFNAGFIYGMLKHGITRDIIDTGLTEEQWDGIVSCALRFSANVCKSINNYIDNDFASEMKQEMADFIEKQQ